MVSRIMVIIVTSTEKNKTRGERHKVEVFPYNICLLDML